MIHSQHLLLRLFCSSILQTAGGPRQLKGLGGPNRPKPSPQPTGSEAACAPPSPPFFLGFFGHTETLALGGLPRCSSARSSWPTAQSSTKAEAYIILYYIIFYSILLYYTILYYLKPRASRNRRTCTERRRRRYNQTLETPRTRELYAPRNRSLYKNPSIALFSTPFLKGPKGTPQAPVQGLSL